MKHLIVFTVVTMSMLIAFRSFDLIAIMLSVTFGSFAVFLIEMADLFEDQNKRIQKQRDNSR